MTAFTGLSHAVVNLVRESPMSETIAAASIAETAADTDVPAVATPPKRRRGDAFTTATIVSFSLTLLCASFAILFGLVPLRAVSPLMRIDIGALLFVMPVVALVLAVCFEVIRIALRSPDLPEPRRRQAVRWSPGRREG
jgi:uncharacterized membrane protein